MLFFLPFYLQIMNPFTLIGFFLALFCGIKHANAIPVTLDATNSVDSTTSVLNNDEKMNSLLYKTADTNGSLEAVNLSQSIVETTTRKPHTDESKPRRRRGQRHRKMSSTRSDCRTITTPPPKTTTTKPTKVYVQFPGLFISHSWGPGRWQWIISIY